MKTNERRIRNWHLLNAYSIITHMIGTKNHSRTPSGFALLVVLSTLAILTLLFAISTRLSLAHIRSQGTEVSLAEQSFQRSEILRLASELIKTADGDATGRHTFTVGSVAHEIEIVDVGGLVDLNTASPLLLSAYFEFLGLTREDGDQFRRWRQTQGRLLRVADLPRIVEESDIDRALLLRTATVHSGRTGIATSVAPATLKAGLGELDQSAIETPPSNTNFAVFAFAKGARRFGVVHGGPQSKVLVAD